MIGIYVLENTIDGKFYVGQSVNVERRLGIHKRAHNDQYIDRAINKHGWDNFKKYTVEISEKVLNKAETEMIKHLNSLAPNGYNLETGGANGRPCAETKKKLSEASKENHIGMLGRYHSEKTKRKQSKAKTAEKNGMFDKHHSPKARASISEALTGDKHYNWKGDNALPMSIRQRARRVERRATTIR